MCSVTKPGASAQAETATPVKYTALTLRAMNALAALLEITETHGNKAEIVS